MDNFWKKFKRPFLALAPMAGITDSPFRQVCKGFGADVVYSEMASVAALTYRPEPTMEMLAFSLLERPYVVQLFGSAPDQFARAAELVSRGVPLAGEFGKIAVPDGIDINFGCPVKKVAKQGAGAVLMQDLKKARETIRAVIGNTDLPVSIKARRQSGSIGILEFINELNDLPITALMIHGRSLAQGFSGQLDTETIRRAGKIFPGLIIANGGVVDRTSADGLLKLSGARGLGIARGAWGRPWLFQEIKTGRLADPAVRGQTILNHFNLVKRLKGKIGVLEFRKHFAWYLAGWPGGRQLRDRLFHVKTVREAETVILKTVEMLTKV